MDAVCGQALHGVSVQQQHRAGTERRPCGWYAGIVPWYAVVCLGHACSSPEDGTVDSCCYYERYVDVVFVFTVAVFIASIVNMVVVVLIWL